MPHPQPGTAEADRGALVESQDNDGILNICEEFAGAAHHSYIAPRPSADMQAVKEAQRDRTGKPAGAAKQVLIAMPDEEIKRLFISLIDPTAMARTDRCIHIAELIGAYSAGARWDKGVRLARTLAEVYGDMSKIADMPTTAGTYADAMHALGDILAYLRRVGRAYRDGRDADPMDGLEEVRATVAGIRKMVAEVEIKEPDGEPVNPDTHPELVEPKRPPETCRKRLMRSEWSLRKDLKEMGDDHIFPPKAKSIVGLLSKYAVPGLSSNDMVKEVRSRGRS